MTRSTTQTDRIRRASWALAWLTVAAAAPASSASAADSVRGNGVPAEVHRDAQGFREIQATGPYRLEVHKDASFQVTVRGDSNIVPLVQTRVDSATLFISVSRPIQPEVPLVVTLSLPSLDAASIAGAVSATVDAFGGPDLRFSVAGSSELEASGIQVDRLAAEVAGASSAQLAGHAREARIAVTGASHVQAEALTAETADVQLIGASSLALGPCTTLTGNAGGASSVIYHGTPESAAGLAADLSSSVQILGGPAR